MKSHPFQEGGGGTVMIHPKGGGGQGSGTSPITAKGRGAVVPLQNTVSPRTILIAKSCPRSGFSTTHTLITDIGGQ